MQGCQELAYHSGFQLSATMEGDSHMLTDDSRYFVWKHDVYLREGAEIFALVHVPTRGKIVPVVSLILDDADVCITARFVRRRSSDEVQDAGDEGVEIEEEVLVSEGKTELRMTEFPNVEQGCYELHIGVKSEWYFCKKFALEFVPRTE